MKLFLQRTKEMSLSAILILFFLTVHLLFIFVDATTTEYDLIVVGLGSGGLAMVKRAASYGKRVAAIEKDKVGGTCVNVGCVLVYMKKLYSRYGLFESFKQFKMFSGKSSLLEAQEPFFEMETNKKARNGYIDRIQASYKRLLSSFPTVDLFLEYEVMSIDVQSPHTKLVTLRSKKENRKEATIQGKKILIATGGRPITPAEFSKKAVDEKLSGGINSSGFSRGITSDEFWSLPGPILPDTVVVVGGGYIAVELASILKALGSKRVILVVRMNRLLSSFDKELVDALHEELTEGQRIEIFYQHQIINISEPNDSLKAFNKASARVTIVNTNSFRDSISISEKKDNKLFSIFKSLNNERKTQMIPDTDDADDDNFTGTNDDEEDDDEGAKERTVNTLAFDADLLIWAIGRKPNTNIQGIPESVKDPRTGLILVDKNTYETNIDGLYAIGDIINGPHLTPVAIASGRRLADQLFGSKEVVKREVSVPTVIFTVPPLGSIGFSEEEANEKYGKENVRVYSKTFTPMLISSVSAMGESIRKRTNKYKLVCFGPELQIVGIHILGPYSEEIIQGFAVAMTTGQLTKEVLDSTIALHPTMAEELLGMN